MKNIKTLILALVFAILLSPVPRIEYIDDNGAVTPVFAAEGDFCETEYIKLSNEKISSRLYELFFGNSTFSKAKVSATFRKNKYSGKVFLIPSGSAFGIKIYGAGVRVTHIANTEGEQPLIENDRIEKVNGVQIHSSDDLKACLKASDGKAIDLDIIRDGRAISLSILPKNIGGEYSLGVIVSDSASGIGTITYIDPETATFGGLGHGICESKSGEVLNMTRGEATSVILGGAVKGVAGSPGELRGVLSQNNIGEIHCNTECGVFGEISAEAYEKYCQGLTPIRAAWRGEVTVGEATILSTVKNGKTAEYKIEITDIDRDASGSKCFRIKVTDETLIAITGGIVRGMSGSPIIQNGKLVGAVTHVMVADPTEGYGIFIDNMLSAAESQALPKAA